MTSKTAVAATTVIAARRLSAVHNEIPLKASQAPHWDLVLDHVGKKAPLGPNGLRNWLEELVFYPQMPASGLLLVGPNQSGKSMFQRAASLLLPEGTAWRYEDYLSESGCEDKPFLAPMRLLLIEGKHQELSKFSTPYRMRGGHYTRWIQALHESESITFPATTLTKIECDAINDCLPNLKLLMRLRDEREAFTESLRSMRYR